MEGVKVTRRGRVVYDRVPHMFSGRDMTRIVTAVNNNDTGSYVHWRYVYELSLRQMAVYTQKLNNGQPQEPLFLGQLDDLVTMLARIGKAIPGYGWLVEVSEVLYLAARGKITNKEEK